MALAKELEELLGTLENEEDRKSARSLLEKYEPLRGGYLRQNDYDRKMNEVKTQREQEQDQIKKYKENSERWQKWSEENVPKHTHLLTEYEKVQARNQELEEAAKKAAAAAGNGAGGDGAVNEEELQRKIEERIGKRGYLTNQEVMKIATEEAQKLANQEREKFMKETLPSILDYDQTLFELTLRHRDEFGAMLDRKTFSKFVAEGKFDDLYKAYDQFTAEKKNEKWKEDERKKIEADLKSKMHFPATGAPPAPELGVIEARKAKVITVPEDSKIGDNAAAYAAAQELRSEGKW